MLLTEVLNIFKTQVVQVMEPPAKIQDSHGSWFGESMMMLDPNESFKSASSGQLTAYPLEYRRSILKASLHVADVSNPARPHAVCVKWAAAVQEEFFRQGDQERALQLPLSMFMDRSVFLSHCLPSDQGQANLAFKRQTVVSKDASRIH